MALPASSTPEFQLARKARELFLGEMAKLMEELGAAVLARYSALVDEVASAREMQDRRDAWIAFQKSRPVWVEGSVSAWQRALQPPTATARVRLEEMSFELLDDEVVDNKILASRIALAVADKVGAEINDLSIRMQRLESVEELPGYDVLRPEVLLLLMVEQWSASGMPREAWLPVHDVIVQGLSKRLVTIYHATNAFLVQRGVMVDIELRHRVKRSAETAPPERKASRSPAAHAPAGDGSAGPARASGRGDTGSSGGWDDTRGGSATDSRGATGAGSGSSGYASGASDETRMMTGSTPLARARQRAQGVMGQLRRMLTAQVAGFDVTKPQPPSAELARAIAPRAQATGRDTEVAGASTGASEWESHDYSPAGVQRVSVEMRERTVELKRKATTSSEKATIEIVALMFQSILAEDRIPPAVRVWFARLQMPVLRVALAEPEFFESLQHPARKLIDRMGSCVMGFDAVSGSALEVEIKRVVQVIEQYPETGRRVFQLVYDEFQKFLGKYLTEQGSAQRVVSVAQQVEQKETMAIQYTIEMRNMLNDMPVREDIREFLFKTWAEVLAVAAVRNGPQHEQTVMLKRCAADLVWAASAKPNRADRARVIQDLPKMLHRLRVGMDLLGLAVPVQDLHIKTISDTLADAFMSKTEAISQERIDVMAKRLSNLEDYLSDADVVGDLPLDAGTLEVMIGIDASELEVVANGGSRPTEAMLAWARELQTGNWFNLDHNGKSARVQYVWHSERRQLHLFASADHRNYLIQARRLAAYLQAGLLVPQEEETLTVRATRDALAKLDANPERLLN
ncbi:MAG: DUF1631 domain-containing protein [Ramlibacter sp.]|jgi:hypothetical protein|nr:DUF1631 domain-containing protein [Ramlibacter sp.]